MANHPYSNYLFDMITKSIGLKINNLWDLDLSYFEKYSGISHGLSSVKVDSWLEPEENVTADAQWHAFSSPQ